MPYLSGGGNQVVWLKNLDRLLSCLKSHSFRHYNFVDLGSGSGIACCYICINYNFKRVIAVEYDEQLIELTKLNTQKLSVALRERMVIKQQNAAHFKLPADKSFVFLLNPFGEDIFLSFMKNNEKLLKKHKSFMLSVNDHLLDVALRYGQLIQRIDKYNISIIGF